MGVIFHDPTIHKPQTIYGINPDNSYDRPFDPITVSPELGRYSTREWTETSAVLESVIPATPLPLASNPFTYIDDIDGLNILSRKLNEVDEFAVDLEANMYRSYQGLTCLMQISTRTEDFVVDTLKLRGVIEHHLGGIFLDPKKRKVMHGACNDVLWLQRDFGVYVCNLFDTMLASKVLNLERNSLGHLLGHYCGVAADKQYQASDWRQRPLPQEMVHYAREDTHYLLYIYDVMRRELAKSSVDPLLEVYQKSHKKCCEKYEKEVFDEESYKNIYGLEDARLNEQQLDVVARLYKWRDCIAREEDEGTGYVMPNKLLLKIAKKMPETREKLKSIIENHNNWLKRKEQAIQNGHMIIYPDHPLSLDNTAQIFKIISPSIVHHQQKMAQVASHDRPRMLQEQKMVQDANQKATMLQQQQIREKARMLQEQKIRAQVANDRARMLLHQGCNPAADPNYQLYAPICPTLFYYRVPQPMYYCPPPQPMFIQHVL